MSKKMMKAVMLEDGTNIEREMTAEEIKQFEKEIAEFEPIRLAQEAQNAERKAAKVALLEKLGITEEEARLLLA